MASIGADGFGLLAAVYDPAAPVALVKVPAVDILRRIWLQQYYALAVDRSTRWREATDTAPAAQLIHSSYDWQARRAKCPQGQTSIKWSETHDQAGSAIVNIRFPPAACSSCEQRAGCTRSAADHAS